MSNYLLHFMFNFTAFVFGSGATWILWNDPTCRVIPKFFRYFMATVTVGNGVFALLYGIVLVAGK
jgi:hypothetical protein